MLLHAVIPVLGILAFIPAWLTALGLGSSFLKFVTPLSYPSSETGLAIGIWYIIGIVVLVYLYLRHPARLPEMRRVFADEEPPAAVGEPVASGKRHDRRRGLYRRPRRQGLVPRASGQRSGDHAPCSACTAAPASPTTTWSR